MPICRCKKDYIGNPLQGCRRECETDRDCSPSQQCSQFKCLAACREGACGENANCAARNNRAECTCPPDFLGDARSRCYTECTRHDDCQDNQACVKFKCKDPCREPDPNVCGSGANCEVKNHKPICSCPRGFTGDPFVSCTRGECENDSECRSDQACFNFSCKDSCQDACGVNAQCKALNHGAICSCPNGYVGDPLTACRAARNPSSSFQQRPTNTRVIGLSRFKRAADYFTGFFF